jgi:hypothetical protein
MSEDCLFCLNSEVEKKTIERQRLKYLSRINPVSPEEMKRLKNTDFSTLPRYSNPSAPEDFGKPYSSFDEALSKWDLYLPAVIAAIAKRVSKKAVPLWMMYMNGGVKETIDLADFDASFITAFAKDNTSQWAANEIVNNVQEYFNNHTGVLPKSTPLVFRLNDIISERLRLFDDYTSKKRLNFSGIGTIPGNLVGDFGPPEDETKNPYGHTPSKQNDSRKVSGAVTVNPILKRGFDLPPTNRDSNKEYELHYDIIFEVFDTIDFCPGGAGNSRDRNEKEPNELIKMIHPLFASEQDLTVPLSRLEASGLVGDVPVKIKYSIKRIETLSI